jgi:hypothetical protein
VTQTPAQISVEEYDYYLWDEPMRTTHAARARVPLPLWEMRRPAIVFFAAMRFLGGYGAWATFGYH